MFLFFCIVYDWNYEKAFSNLLKLKHVLVLNKQVGFSLMLKTRKYLDIFEFQFYFILFVCLAWYSGWQYVHSPGVCGHPPRPHDVPSQGGRSLSLMVRAISDLTAPFSSSQDREGYITFSPLAVWVSQYGETFRSILV